MWKASLAILALALLAGCQKPPDAGTPGPGGTASKTGKLNIVFIPKSSGNAYFTDIESGFQDAAKESGDTYTTAAPSQAKATDQVQLIKDQIQRKADVIVVSASSPDELDPALDEAARSGILVMTVDSDITGNESHRQAAILQAANDEVGKSQIELLGKMINYDGEFAILSATKDAPNQNAWIAAMQQTLKDPKYAKMKLVDIVYGDDDAAKSTTEFEALVTNHPNLRGVISPTSVGLAAAAGDLERMGIYPGGPNAKGAGLVLTGLSTPNQMKEYVKKGVVQAFQLWRPHDMGYMAAMLADQIKAGKVKPAEGVKFTAGSLGEQTFGKDCVVNGVKLITFDKSDIDKYDF